MSETKTFEITRRKKRGFFGAVLRWGEFVKFSHTIFAMPFALASMMVASREHFGRKKRE